jgi:Flp pilus assembly pilin Flp
MKKALKNLWQDESAQGATEYILMLVIVVGIALLFKKQIMSVITDKVTALGEDIGNFKADN